MAKNPDNSRANRHSGYYAVSGGGKTLALKQNPDIPPRGRGRVLLWDPYEDHEAVRFTRRSTFARQLAAAVKSGQPFRLALTVDDTPSNFEWFCAAVWSVLDGNQETVVICEEIAEVCPTTGKAGPQFGRLLRGSRKFGGVLHMTSQRVAEIPKTAISQAGYRYIGIQDEGDIRRMAAAAGVKADQLRELQPLQFYCKQAGHPAELLQLNAPRKTRRTAPKGRRAPAPPKK